MEIEKDILNALKIDEYCVLKKFISQRNEVYKIAAVCADKKLSFVYKVFRHGELEKEYKNLTLLAGLRVPAVLARTRTALCLEYMEGRTMLQLLETHERQNKPFDACIRAWVKFLQPIYQIMPGMIYGDVNFRNFILRKNNIYGVDLEELCPGEIKTDIGRAAAFLLTYDPAFSEYKQKTVQVLISLGAQLLNISKEEIECEMQQELRKIGRRRGISESRYMGG